MVSFTNLIVIVFSSFFSLVNNAITDISALGAALAINTSLSYLEWVDRAGSVVI